MSTRATRGFRSSRTQCSRQRHVDHAVGLRDADALAEVADRLGRVAAAAQAGDRRHARIVPARDVLALDELQELPLAHHGVVEVEPRELDLLRRLRQQRSTRAVDAASRRAARWFSNSSVQSECVMPSIASESAVRVVVHRVDAPGVAGAVVGGVPDAVEQRVAQVHVGRRHVDLRAQHVRAVGELAGPHAREEVEVLRDRPVAVRAVLARLGDACRGARGSRRSLRL